MLAVCIGVSTQRSTVPVAVGLQWGCSGAAVGLHSMQLVGSLQLDLHTLHRDATVPAAVASFEFSVCSGLCAAVWRRQVGVFQCRFVGRCRVGYNSSSGALCGFSQVAACCACIPQSQVCRPAACLGLWQPSPQSVLAGGIDDAPIVRQ